MEASDLAPMKLAKEAAKECEALLGNKAPAKSFLLTKAAIKGCEAWLLRIPARFHPLTRTEIRECELLLASMESIVSHMKIYFNPPIHSVKCTLIYMTDDILIIRKVLKGCHHNGFFGPMRNAYRFQPDTAQRLCKHLREAQHGMREDWHVKGYKCKDEWDREKLAIHLQRGLKYRAELIRDGQLAQYAGIMRQSDPSYVFESFWI